MIRPATPHDHEAVAILCGELGYPTPAAEVAARLELLGRDASTPVFVFEQTGQVVGWMQLRESSTLESGRSVEVIGLVVGHAERGKGVGAALIAFAKGWARTRGHTSLRVRTNQVRTRTHAFYERLGFSLTKVQRVYDAPL
ncbi:MAG: GNAT family N-acetyltransferase [Phycisphaerales bacterium]